MFHLEGIEVPYYDVSLQSREKLDQMNKYVFVTGNGGKNLVDTIYMTLT